MPNARRWAASPAKDAAIDGLAATARPPSTNPRSTATMVRVGPLRVSGPRLRRRNPVATSAATSGPMPAMIVVSAEPALPDPTSIRSPIAVTAPSAENPAPAVTARVLASTRCRFSSTTCGSATDSPASTNRLNPIAASAPR